MKNPQRTSNQLRYIKFICSPINKMITHFTVTDSNMHKNEYKTPPVENMYKNFGEILKLNVFSLENSFLEL